jgi:ribosome-associated toxin RatA of RatAB toxin-antitoxin module
MKELHGSASVPVAASPDRCLALLEAVDEYPTWYPEVVQEATVLERDARGRPTRVKSTLHVARGPLVKDFHLVLAVISDGQREVKLMRLHEAGSGDEEFEAHWHVEQAVSARIRLDLTASLDVPRFLPLGGIGDSMAEGFVAAAANQLRGG